MELNPTTFDTLAIQYIEAIHVTKSCFAFAFYQISLHPPVSGLYNFPRGVERAEKSEKRKKKTFVREFIEIVST